MKLSSISLRLISLTLAFVLIVVAAQTSNPQERNTDESIQSAQQKQAGNQQTRWITTRGKKVSILLHGLMVGRYKRGSKKRFEVGIIRRAPKHKFSFSVYSDGK